MSEHLRTGVLITRPEPQAQETAVLIAACGLTPFIAPMLGIVPHAWTWPLPSVQAVVVTSANALAALSALPRATPLYAVGDATARRAEANGFTCVHSAGRDANALVALVAARCQPAAGRLLLASGAGLGRELGTDLRAHGFKVLRRVAYSARAARRLPEPVMTALHAHRIGHALFYSAASARAFVACMLGQGSVVEGVQALAISQPTAHVLAPLPWRRIRVASHPNQDELVALLS